MRCNCFNTITENGYGVTYDELNEFLNTCNKGCDKCYDFNTVSSAFHNARGVFLI